MMIREDMEQLNTLLIEYEAFWGRKKPQGANEQAVAKAVIQRLGYIRRKLLADMDKVNSVACVICVKPFTPKPEYPNDNLCEACAQTPYFQKLIKAAFEEEAE